MARGSPSDAMSFDASRGSSSSSPRAAPAVVAKKPLRGKRRQRHRHRVAPAAPLAKDSVGQRRAARRWTHPTEQTHSSELSSVEKRRAFAGASVSRARDSSHEHPDGSSGGGSGGGGVLLLNAEGGEADASSITVDDKPERIISIHTTQSGRRTVTRTETGLVITQPVFFSPGGVVSTTTVPIYEAEAAVSMASLKSQLRKKPNSGRK